LFRELGTFGARPDDAHVSHQHVDELRQLVEARFPQHLADARDARVVRAGHDDTGVFLGVRPHRPEFQHAELMKSWTRRAARGRLVHIPQLAGPTLMNEDASRRFQEDGDGDEWK
jgi:hypothetical protein